MYPIEIYSEILNKIIRNNARLNGCIFESYMINEVLNFSSMYLSRIKTKFIIKEPNVKNRKVIDDNLLLVFS